MQARASDIWVMGDCRSERLFELSLRAMGAAEAVAAATDAKTVMLLCFDGAAQQLEAYAAAGGPARDTAIHTAFSHGADYVYQCQHPDLAGQFPDGCAAALARIMPQYRPRLVIFALTDFGRETAARLAARTETGLIADCVHLDYAQQGMVARCPAWGGTVMADIDFVGEAATGLITVDPHAWSVIERPGNPGQVISIRLEDRLLSECGPELLELGLAGQGARSLEESEVVVVGGAGMGSMEGFGLVRDLARAMDGEVGATRPPVLNHWVEEERLIGQTGKRVRPRLLISAGTSGAVQYTAGIQDAATIVAINRDPNAPIFQTADMGVVADARQFLPLLTEKIRQKTMRHLADALGPAVAGEAPGGFGGMLARLRKSQDWSVETLAEATGESPDFIRQVEEGVLTPAVGFLLRFSKALNVDPGTFLRQEEKTQLRDMRAQALVKRTRSYSYETLSSGTENDHLRAFMVTIDARQAHKPVAYKHEGEEFIFVMEGELSLTLDKQIYNLKTGESIHFNSNKPHKLKSISSTPTRCLVVLYTP